MFIELTLATTEPRRIWIKASSILALTTWEGNTNLSLSGISDDEGISVIESPQAVMAKISESVRWNR